MAPNPLSRSSAQLQQALLSPTHIYNCRSLLFSGGMGTTTTTTTTGTAAPRRRGMFGRRGHKAHGVQVY